MSAPIFGYGACVSGLNNQKYSLLGLLLHARRNFGSAALPDLINHVTAGRSPTSVVPFSKIFDCVRLTEAATRMGVPIIDDPQIINVSFHDMFNLGSSASRDGSPNRAVIVRDFWKNLRPAPELESEIAVLTKRLFGEMKVQAVLQLRIEPDWQKYVASAMRPVEGEDATTSYREILTKVSATLGDEVKSVYVTCDEHQVPTGEISAFARSLGIDLIWKSQILNSDYSGAELCRLTTIDFEIAVRAPVFIGMSRSTFANAVVSNAYALDDAATARHYIYNAPGSFLALRQDRGAYADWRQAICG